MNAEFIFEETSTTTGAMVMDAILTEATGNDNNVGSDLYIVPSRTTVDGKCF